MSESLLSCWAATVRAAPDGIAVIDATSGRRWTRAELSAESDGWRKQWASVPLQGHRVLMAEPNGPQWFAVFLGLLAEGAIAVPADPTEPWANLLATARAIGAPWYWHEGELRRTEETSRRRPRDLCLVKLTSGSTGTPRALDFTHAQMLADGRQICASMEIRPDDVNLAVIPLGHSYGLGNLVLPLLEQGTAMVCPGGPLPRALAEDCARWRPTVFPAVPTLLQALVRSEVEVPKFASLRLVISAGAPLTAELAATFTDKFERRIHSFYGSSETGGITYDRSGDATLTARSVGTPLEGVTLEFRRGNRLRVRSAAVTGRGEFSPPDYVRLNAEGELVLLGRSGRTVKVAGRRLNLAEVEAALLAVPGVRAGCALPHPNLPDRLAAVVETDLTPLAVREHLATRLAAWKIPDRLVAVSKLPTTARGKLDRNGAVGLLSAPIETRR